MHLKKTTYVQHTKFYCVLPVDVARSSIFGDVDDDDDDDDEWICRVRHN